MRRKTDFPGIPLTRGIDRTEDDTLAAEHSKRVELAREAASLIEDPAFLRTIAAVRDEQINAFLFSKPGREGDGDRMVAHFRARMIDAFVERLVQDVDAARNLDKDSRDG